MNSRITPLASGGPGREDRVSRVSSALLPVAAAFVLLLGACSGDEDSSGLATPVDTAQPPATVPESEQVESAGIVTSPPETTERATATTAETTAEETTANPTESTAEKTATTAAETTTTGDGPAAEDPPASTMPEPAPAGPGEDDAATADADLSDEERLLRFADCMRENGVDFPDPVVEADGTVTFGFRPGAGGAGAAQEIGRDPDLPAAREACEHLLEGLSFGPGSGNFDTTELQDALLEFAQCMRDNGVDMGDPDLSDFGPGRNRDGGPPGGPFGGIDFQDPDVVAALELCQEEVNLRFGRRPLGANS